MERQPSVDRQKKTDRQTDKQIEDKPIGSAQGWGHGHINDVVVIQNIVAHLVDNENRDLHKGL